MNRPSRRRPKATGVPYCGAMNSLSPHLLMSLVSALGNA